MITITTVINTEGEKQKHVSVTVKSADFNGGAPVEKRLALFLRELTMAVISMCEGGHGESVEKAKLDEFIKRTKREGSGRN